MCDTIFNKCDDRIIFGKNSDRSPNEPNLTIYYPKRQNNKMLQCTYISIEDISSTNAILLVQPSWMWGGEMGINDHGVMIGNEAVFTKSRGKKVERLLGMDMLRLALERSNSAKEARDVIVSLIKQYGQGGNCGFDKPFYYDNSYIIADKKDAYVLESSGQEYFTFKINNKYNISNRISNQNGGFKKQNSDFLFTHFSGSLIRESDACKYLDEKDFDLRTMIQSLRHHNPKDENHLYKKGSVKSICMHKSLLGDHTTASMIVVANHQTTTIWLTGCSTPCLSLYKPTYFSNITPPVYKNPQDSLTYWLKREYLVRAIYGGLINKRYYLNQLNDLQNKFINEEEILLKTNPSISDLHAFAVKCSKEEQEFVNLFKTQIKEIKDHPEKLPRLWRKITKKLGNNVFERTLEKRIKY